MAASHPTPQPQAVEFPLKVSQTAAILEVVHSAVGLVRSPVGITGERAAADQGIAADQGS